MEYDKYAYEPFAVTVDLAVLTIRDGALHVLLVERGQDPYAGHWALPGGFVEPRESAETAARRELAEETGLADLTGLHLEQLRTYSEPDRDPRMRVVSVAFTALLPDAPEPRAGSDAARASWLPYDSARPLSGAGEVQARPHAAQHAPPPSNELRSARAGGPPSPHRPKAQVAPPPPSASLERGDPHRGPSSGTPRARTGCDISRSRGGRGTAPALPRRRLAFDHDTILADAHERVGAKLEYTCLATAFCPPEFTLGELQHVYETVWGTALDRPNFRRKVLATPGFVEAVPGGARLTGGRGKPAALYRAGPATALHPPLLRPSREGRPA